MRIEGAATLRPDERAVSTGDVRVAKLSGAPFVVVIRYPDALLEVSATLLRDCHRTRETLAILGPRGDATRQ
jgi:hypothetical protein